jgi:hypothetical protein
MLSTEFEYLWKESECFLQGWNAFFRVGMLSTVLECFRESWNTFVHGLNAFESVRMLSTGLEYLCTGLEYFRFS